MAYDLHESVAYYRQQGAPGNQQMLIALLRQVQTAHGGSLTAALLRELSDLLGVKETFLRAVIRRIPDLRAEDGERVLELCAGEHCRRSRALAQYAEELGKERGFTVRYVPCMRLCGKGPNLRWDGKLYHKVDESLLRKLTEK